MTILITWDLFECVAYECNNTYTPSSRKIHTPIQYITHLYTAQSNLKQKDNFHSDFTLYQNAIETIFLCVIVVLRNTNGRLENGKEQDEQKKLYTANGWTTCKMVMLNNSIFVSMDLLCAPRTKQFHGIFGSSISDGKRFAQFVATENGRKSFFFSLILYPSYLPDKHCKLIIFIWKSLIKAIECLLNLWKR